MLKKLGTYRKRAMGLIRMAEEYLAPGWTDARELFGVGKYGSDAWHLFVVGDWQAVAPNDYALVKYRDWLEQRELAKRIQAVPEAIKQPRQEGHRRSTSDEHSSSSFAIKN